MPPALSLGGCAVTPLQVHFWFRRSWIYKLKSKTLHAVNTLLPKYSQPRDASVTCITFKGEMPVKEEIDTRKLFFTSKHLPVLKTWNRWRFMWPERFEFILSSEQPSSRQNCLLKDAHTSTVPIRTSRVSWNQLFKVFLRDKGKDGTFPPGQVICFLHCASFLTLTTPWHWLYTLRTGLSEVAARSLSLTFSPPCAGYFHVPVTETIKVRNIYFARGSSRSQWRRQGRMPLSGVVSMASMRC